MGDPRKIRRKYSGPRHPWEGARILEEKVLMKEYGLTNKQEIWKMGSQLTKFKDQVKKLTAMTGAQAEKEKAQMMNKLTSLGLLDQGATMDDVLDLNIKNILERRLQSIVFRSSMAKSMKQARQFVVHEHVTVNGKKINFPSYLVKVGEQVAFAERSDLNDEMHPERAPPTPSKEKIEKKKEKKDEEEEVLAFKEEEILDEDQLALAELKKKEAAESEEPKQEKPKGEEKVPAEEPAEQSEAGDEMKEDKVEKEEKAEEETAPSKEAPKKEEPKEDKK
ncbi:30S ribosomal protein S4 [Nanoarchaeota archaeon]